MEKPNFFNGFNIIVLIFELINVIIDIWDFFLNKKDGFMQSLCVLFFLVIFLLFYHICKQNKYIKYLENQSNNSSVKEITEIQGERINLQQQEINKIKESPALKENSLASLDYEIIDEWDDNTK